MLLPTRRGGAWSVDPAAVRKLVAAAATGDVALTQSTVRSEAAPRGLAFLVCPGISKSHRLDTEAWIVARALMLRRRKISRSGYEAVASREVRPAAEADGSSPRARRVRFACSGS